MIKKKLGGERLGSGNKMEVGMHGYDRSTHDLSYIWRSTMSAGTLVPFMSEVALPGDTFDIDLDINVRTHPTIGPLFGRFKVQADVYSVPIRLYNAKLHNNMLGIGMNMAQVILPQIVLEAINPVGGLDNIDNEQINPSCLLNYLGIRGVGIKKNAQQEYRLFNGVPILAYWEIYKNYYANKQEGKGAVIHREEFYENVQKITQINPTGTNIIPKVPGTATNGQIGSNDQLEIELNTPYVQTLANIILRTSNGDLPLESVFREDYRTATGIYGTMTNPVRMYIYAWDYQATTSLPIRPKVATFDLDNIDEMRSAILQHSINAPFIIASPVGSQPLDKAPYKWLADIDATGAPYNKATQEGLGIKTYQSDLFNNWLETSWVTQISTTSAVSTVAGFFTMDQLNLSKKVYEMLNRIAISGGTYDDWLDAVYSNDRMQRAESPIYMGGKIKELAFQEVISNTETDTQPLGTLAGRGVMTDKDKGGRVHINVQEPSYIIGIISLTPLIDYSQGNKWDVNLETMDDLHKPALDEIGFQDLITEQMAWWTTYHDGTKWTQTSAGKQPAWLNYMTNVNQTKGNFAIKNNEMFMTLNRGYEHELFNGVYRIKDLTTYIDPVKYNQIFADTSLDAQNFWTQMRVGITARRKLSAKIMPNL